MGNQEDAADWTGILMKTDVFSGLWGKAEEDDAINAFFLQKRSPSESKKFMEQLKLKRRQQHVQQELQRISEEKQRRAEAELTPIQPKSLEEIEDLLRIPLTTTNILEKYFLPFTDESTRSDPASPQIRVIPQTHVARMKQLVECFPEGIAAPFFLSLYKKVLGNAPRLNGFRFPKDSDPHTAFKLPSVFWIPDYDSWNFPETLLFPVESAKKYGGSLKSVLEVYWNLFLEFMRDKKALPVTEMFYFEDNEPLFFAMTGMWFSYKRWGLPSYTRFLELLVETFDPGYRQWTVLYLPSDEPGVLSQRVFVVASGENGEYARKFENAALRKFTGVEDRKKEPEVEQPPPPEKRVVTWKWEAMRFPAREMLERSERRIFEVVTAGNIWNFYLFYVVLVKDIGKRDRLLERINEIMVKNTAFTVPEKIYEKGLVMFQNTRTSCHVWRRGVVLQHDTRNGTIMVLDIDTGETNIQVPADTLRNMTADLFHLPVLAIPVRFSVHPNQKRLYNDNSAANRVLGKYLHMLLVDGSRGMRLRFHRWETSGAWVVSGYLMDIIHKIPVQPQVSLARYILDKFESRPWDEFLPEWEERIETEEENWSIQLMRPRQFSIQKMINYCKWFANQPKKCFVEGKARDATDLDIDKGRKEESVESIFVDVELDAPEQPESRVGPPWGPRLVNRRCRVNLKVSVDMAVKKQEVEEQREKVPVKVPSRTRFQPPLPEQPDIYAEGGRVPFFFVRERNHGTSKMIRREVSGKEVYRPAGVPKGVSRWRYVRRVEYVVIV